MRIAMLEGFKDFHDDDEDPDCGPFDIEDAEYEETFQQSGGVNQLYDVYKSNGTTDQAYPGTDNMPPGTVDMMPIIRGGGGMRPMPSETAQITMPSELDIKDILTSKNFVMGVVAGLLISKLVK